MTWVVRGSPSASASPWLGMREARRSAKDSSNPPASMRADSAAWASGS